MKMQTATSGSGPTVVLVGGGLTGWQSWIPIAERLSTTRTVIRAQPLSVQLGLENAALPDGYSIEMESAALEAALDATPVDVVGWSYGAFVALDYALDHPERIRSLTLIEPPAFWVLSATNRMDDRSRDESRAMRALYLSMTADVSPEQLVTFCKAAGFVPEGTNPQDMPQWPSWLEHRRSLRTGTAAWDHLGSLARLETFPRPVLLLKGKASSHFLHAITDALAGTLPRAEVLELPGGHAMHLEATDVFLARLAAFHASA
jgi:pimeloyl-ACP methyl ester carboxylesterase